MKTFEIVLTFSHNEPTTKFLEEAIATFVTDVRKLGFTLSVASAPDTVQEFEPVPEPEPEEPAAELDLDFASDKAAELASANGLTNAAFADVEPSGKTGGYTVGDVRKVIGA